jgi:hypothetical protein
MPPNQIPNLPPNPNQLPPVPGSPEQPLAPGIERPAAPVAPEVAPPPPAAAPSLPLPPVPPALPPTPPPPAPSTVTAPATPPSPAIGPTPSAAGDVDVIEKEWVDQADKIIEQTKGDPYVEEEAEEALQQDYLKKRYNHDVKKPDTT